MDLNAGWLIGPADEGRRSAFLEKWKPSADLGTLPWYWVQTPRKNDDKLKPAEDEADKHQDFVENGSALVEQMMAECARIKAEAPVRANKSKGIKSQKELREAEHAKFNDQVQELAQKHGILSGKWLLYPSKEAVDAVWAKIVEGVASPEGALAKTGACHTAKVATSAQGEAPYVICVYCDDSWDKDGVGKVFKAIVNELGLVPSAYKHDANTLLGIDSKHPSQIKSSLYGKNDFMTKEEIDQLMSAKSKAREAKTEAKTAEQEEEEEGAGFQPLSDSDDDARPVKKAKKAK